MRHAHRFIVDVHRAETPEELAQIFSLRYRRFVTEQGKEPPWADHDKKQLRDPSDEDASNFYLKGADGRIVACARGRVGGPPVSCEEAMQIHRFGRLSRSHLYYVSRIVLDADRGSHLALLKLMLMMYKDARDRGARIGLAHCRPDLTRLYRRAAWRPYAPVFVDPVSGSQVPIMIVAEDVETIAKCNPLMLQLAQKYQNDKSIVDWCRREFGETRSCGKLRHTLSGTGAPGADTTQEREWNIVASDVCPDFLSQKAK